MMGMAEWTLVGTTLFALFMGGYGWLISRQVNSMEKGIDRIDKEVLRVETSCKSDSAKLWEEHGIDVQRLNAAEVKLAGHPDRSEMTEAIARMLSHIDNRFEDMKGYISDRRTKS